MAYEFNHYYELQNVATGKYVNVLGNHEDGTVKNGEAVNLFNRTNNPDQRWALENYGGNGNVRIVLQRGEGWYALNYNTRNANCIVWHLNTADDIDTVITAGSGYLFNSGRYSTEMGGLHGRKRTDVYNS